jgi:hypothetical protein
MNKYHYVYRITNTKLNKHYYGVRTSNIEPSKDLGVKYFSSSSDIEFRNDQKNNPQDYKYVIVSILKSREEAMMLEIKLHENFNVDLNDSFYNKTKANTIGFSNAGKHHSVTTKNKISVSNSGKTRDEQQRKNISESLAGRKLSPQHSRKIGEVREGIPRKSSTKDKISEKLKGIKHSDGRKLNISKSLIGRKLTDRQRESISIGSKNREKISEETRLKLSIAKSVPQKSVKCTHCDKIGGLSNMTRYHFDNCKQNPNI